MASPRERRLPPSPAFRMENPFSLKVLQVFTGAGVGCGVGVGVGRPIYLGMIPGLQQVMSATRGATDSFSGVTRHINSALRKVGLKNIEAGIGCGVGIGHGFGIGIALKPRVIHDIQSSVTEVMSKLTSKLKDSPGVSATSNLTAGSLPTNGQTPNGMPMDLEVEAKTVESNFHHTSSNEISQVQPTHGLHGQHGMQPETITGSRTEKVIANFLQSPLFQNNTKTDIRDAAVNLHGMDNVLQLILKHQRVIDELRDENEKLRQVLIEELKVSPTKLQLGRENGVKAYYPCSECFDCRRRSRKSNR
ncbi:uncharacterized protein LOC100824000 isoform X2 [Brachypodium distachyon]|uniref:Uncharacterized protein n=1 Tax=Brachypodium distachyon TaxID=15368 RepID=I1I675_BRADI|nr:uncharacterized protein LOC100824000 isoform X1 [Brachypodium distachyon]XP_010235004.1 uncharacterized protein LOC100824000 isoform X2 [Brachypodium distachyon]KQJ97823.1 hypothetical protein BRADI_3g33530v3 [Brachypodium distachyon]|eukprot:XP_003574341.1 uncharacterized protein LOC100824000 isoform X1 [Brachypodium distachyon]